MTAIPIFSYPSNKIHLENSGWFLAGICLLYLSVAYASSGYNNADEHFQIIEFANYKMGRTSASDLAWEFNAKIRPGLQPMICWILMKLALWAGWNDPYGFAFFLRALTAAVSVLIIRFFIRSYIHAVEVKNRNIFIVISYLLWFLPYINVRFSSESWSGLFFLLSLAIVQRDGRENKTKMPYIFGGVAGISILFRYQSAILVSGLFLWIFFIRGRDILLPLKAGLAVLAVLLGGLFIDYWLYNGYFFTLYNYFHVNLVENVASQYGISPWYQIIFYIVFSPGPIGILLFAALVILAFKKPDEPILWAVIPFLVVHAIIPHKELRFLFPLANLVPIILILFLQQVGNFTGFFKKVIWPMIMVLLIVSNIMGIISIATRGAGNGKIAITQFIYRKYKNENIILNCVEGLNPYSDWAFPKDRFYEHSKVEISEISTIWKPALLKNKIGYKNLLLISKDEITGPRTIEMLRKKNYSLVFQNTSGFIQIINMFYDPKLNDNVLFLYELKLPDKN